MLMGKMPYKSKAQQRFFHAAEARGEMSQRTVKEFDTATKGRYGKLPEHASKQAHSRAVKALKGEHSMREHAKKRGR